jgi:hypothetical protein
MRRTFLSAFSAFAVLALAACSSGPSRGHAATYQRATPAIAANGGLAVGDSVGAVAFQQTDSRVASVLISDE